MNEEIKKKKKIHTLISRNCILETIKRHYMHRQKRERKATNTQTIFYGIVELKIKELKVVSVWYMCFEFMYISVWEYVNTHRNTEGREGHWMSCSIALHFPCCRQSLSLNLDLC